MNRRRLLQAFAAATFAAAVEVTGIQPKVELEAVNQGILDFIYELIARDNFIWATPPPAPRTWDTI